jgi:hypothetical protein
LGNFTNLIPLFHLDFPWVARGVTDPGGGSGTVLGRLFHVRQSSPWVLYPAIILKNAVEPLIFTDDH